MSDNEQVQTGGTSMLVFFILLAVALITLKLTGYIAWSWWWVLLPFAFALALFAIVSLLYWILK